MLKFLWAVAALVCISMSMGSVYILRSPDGVDSLIGPGSLIERVSARLPFVDKLLCLPLPKPAEPFDSLDKDDFKQWIPAVRFVTNPEQLSVDDGIDGGSSLRQRFMPSEKGSLRVVAAINLEPGSVYELEQSIMFEEGFDWGGEIESGKFGFGLAGGSAPTGGTVANDGFSARLLWKGHGDGTASPGAYLYSVDRNQNLPYGDEFEFSDYKIATGRWFKVTMRLLTNSDLEKNDGVFQVWIDGQILFERKNIQWQSDGASPVIDQILYSSFHGGNTEQWSPDNVVYSRVTDICIFKDRQKESSTDESEESDVRTDA